MENNIDPLIRASYYVYMDGKVKGAWETEDPEGSECAWRAFDAVDEFEDHGWGITKKTKAVFQILLKQLLEKYE